MKIVFSLLFVSLGALAQEVKLSEYDWNLTDISNKGIERQSLFDKMDRVNVRVSDSICSNRALMWAHDFKNKYDIDSAKVFLFFTEKTGEAGLKTWWYHVAPIINENGKLWVMDAGFPGAINGPLKIDEWLKFWKSSNCKEIKSGENELIERMFIPRTYPETTVYGRYSCYYRIVPGSFWTPSSVAMNLLGVDERGRPVRFERPEIDKGELFQACVEAVTSKLDYALGGGKKKCKELLGL